MGTGVYYGGFGIFWRFFLARDFGKNSRDF